MAELIQFHCPACGTMLRLPLAMAAQQGPCPNCDREIVAPDPYRGTGAYQIPVPPPPAEIEPFRPFAESPPVIPQEQEAAAVEIPEPKPVRETAAPLIAEVPAAPMTTLQIPACAKPQRAVLVLSCLLTAAVALAWGFALGVRSNQYFTRIPPMATPTIPPAAVAGKPVAAVEPKAVEPVPVPVLVKPVIEAPKMEPKPETTRVSAAAEASLKAFLDAPDWAARSAYVLSPEATRSAMEAYSREVPDGPTAYTSVSVKQSHLDEKTGNTLFIFYVNTEKFPTGIPIAIQETAGGWLVDWQTFVEFRDSLFQKFVEGPIDKTGRFHLVVTTPPPDRAANTENEHFSSFLLQSPVSGTQQLAFVRKKSEAFDMFQTATRDGKIFTPVLDVSKRKTADGQSYFEVSKVLATDWLPR